MEHIDIEGARAQMRKGSLELAALLTISRGETYASDMLDELKKAGLIVVEGTLYPLLSRLRAERLVDYRWVESNAGPPRKYYTLTPAGRETLDHLVKTWHALEWSINSLITSNEKDN